MEETFIELGIIIAVMLVMGFLTLQVIKILEKKQRNHCSYSEDAAKGDHDPYPRYAATEKT